MNHKSNHGKILPGDYLTASSKAGYAAKADDNSIVLIGRALEPLNQSEGKISAFIQITTKNPILDFNMSINSFGIFDHAQKPKVFDKERLLEEEEKELDELEEKYEIDLEEIKQTKASKETKLQRIKKKLELESAVTQVQQAPQISYMEKVNGSVIVRLG